MIEYIPQYQSTEGGVMEEFSILLIILGALASLFLLVLWIMLPVAVFKISSKMDKILARLNSIINKME